MFWKKKKNKVGETDYFVCYRKRVALGRILEDAKIHLWAINAKLSDKRTTEAQRQALLLGRAEAEAEICRLQDKHEAAKVEEYDEAVRRTLIR